MFVVNVDKFFLSHRIHIAKAALRSGYEVHLATMFTSHEEQLRDCGFKLHSIYIDRQSLDITSNLRSFIHIFRVFISVRPSVVHLIAMKAVILGGVISRLLRVPNVVTSITGFGRFQTDAHRYFSTKDFLIHFALRYSLRLTTVIVQNANDADIIRNTYGIDESRIALIAGVGVNLKEFSPIHEHPKGNLILFAGRLIQQKGVREFVEAARTLKSELPEVKFLIAGGIDFENSSAIRHAELRYWVSEGLIEWVGYCADIRPYLAKCSLVCLPSYYGEGLPKILIEAAAMGRAIVTTDIPGCRDAVVHGVTGLIVPPKDTRSLSAAIKTLITNRELVVRLGANARKHAEKYYDDNDVVLKHLTIYGFANPPISTRALN